MKTILCFGDSLTWGYNAQTVTRFPYEQRWTTVLQNKLGAGYRVIEEGLGGRTTVSDNPYSPYRNGSTVLPMFLESHAPIDLLVLLLGTNDIKSHILGSARKAAMGCSRLIRIILASQAGPNASAPAILLLAPPHLGKLTNLTAISLADAEQEAKHFAEHYAAVADFLKTHFLDTSKFLVTDPADGVHLDSQNNARLGSEVATKIKTIFNLNPKLETVAS